MTESLPTLDREELREQLKAEFARVVGEVASAPLGKLIHDKRRRRRKCRPLRRAKTGGDCGYKDFKLAYLI